jgi:hypothetical protein
MIEKELEASPEQKFEDDIEKASEMIKQVKEELSKKIVGQSDLIDSLLI